MLFLPFSMRSLGSSRHLTLPRHRPVSMRSLPRQFGPVDRTARIVLVVSPRRVRWRAARGHAHQQGGAGARRAGDPEGAADHLGALPDAGDPQVLALAIRPHGGDIEADS